MDQLKNKSKLIRSKILRKFKEKISYRSKYGLAINEDSRSVMDFLPDASVDLVFTSPPFPLIKKKSYGNVGEEEYIEWFSEFAEKVHRILKDTGSFVVDLGSAWIPGRPVRSLYEMKLCLRLTESLDFRLAQDFYWWNPNRLPTPAQWVTVKRERVKDAVDRIYWFSKTDHPKAFNKNVSQPYTERMHSYIRGGKNKHARRPSGHRPSEKFINDNGGAIPPNLLAVSNGGGSAYVKYCKENNFVIHPARFPYDLPEFFMRLLTEEGDLIFDPFAGSCTTGAAAESLERFWLNAELNNDYLKGVKGHFLKNSNPRTESKYTIYKPRYVDL